MSIFICSCLLLLFNSLLLILTFIALHVLRKTCLFRENESNYVSKVGEKDGNFSFKLLFQICKYKDAKDKVMQENVCSMTSSYIQKYQSGSNKDKNELLLVRNEEEENDDDKHVEKNKHIFQAEKNIKREIYPSEMTSKVEMQSYGRETKQRQIQFEEESKNEVGKSEEDSSNNDSSNSLYVSYEQQHTIDNHAIHQKNPKVEEEKSKKTYTLDLDEDKFEEIWEHQDVIMLLEMELKKVRAIGLPTILEESESPKAIEESKSSKIDEKLFQGDTMDDLHKLYECYKEGMKKFDILNYQKMYATCKCNLCGEKCDVCILSF